MVFFSLFISLYASLFFLNCYNKKNKILYIIFCLFILLEGINNIYYYGKKFYSYDDIINSYVFMGWQSEYLPVNTNYYLYLKDRFGLDVDNLEYKFNINKGNASINIINDNGKYLKFRVSNVLDNVSIVIPRVYYLGYYLYDDKGNNYKLYQSEYGMIKANIKNNGIYNLTYKSTLFDRITCYIRLFTFLFITGYGGIYLWKKKRL